jgi:hypothetical protein
MDVEGIAQDGAEVRGGKALPIIVLKNSYACMRHIAFANF